MVSDAERYLFDVNGFVVVENALQSSEVERLNQLIDELDLNNPDKRTTQGYCTSFLERDAAFRNLIDHPRILPYLHAWIQSGLGQRKVRLDHAYFIFSDPGDAGKNLHFGATPYLPSCSYHFRDGHVFSALTVVSYALTDVPQGQGGFACVPGSHKAHYPCTSDIISRSDTSSIFAPRISRGDAIIFTEALTHGSLPWTASHQRRALFYKYCPSYMAWMLPRWSEKLIAQCNPAQQQMLLPPYVSDEPVFFDPPQTACT